MNVVFTFIYVPLGVTCVGSSHIGNRLVFNSCPLCLEAFIPIPHQPINMRRCVVLSLSFTRFQGHECWCCILMGLMISLVGPVLKVCRAHLIRCYRTTGTPSILYIGILLCCYACCESGPSWSWLLQLYTKLYITHTSFGTLVKSEFEGFEI